MNQGNENLPGLAIAQSEKWGVLERLPVGKKLLVTTEGRIYTIERRPDGFYISGHPKHCPEPVKASITFATLLVGPAGRLVYEIEGKGRVYSSKILDTKEE